MKLFSVFFLLFAAMQIAAENLPDWIKTGPDGVMRIFEDSVTINSDGKAELREIIAIKKISLPAKFSLKILSKDDFKRIKKEKEIIMEEPFYFPEFFGKGILPCERKGEKIKCALENDSTLKVDLLKAKERTSVLFLVVLISLFFSASAFPVLYNKFEENDFSAEKMFLCAISIMTIIISSSMLLGLHYLIKLLLFSRAPTFPALLLFLTPLLGAISGILLNDDISVRNYYLSKNFLLAAFICLFLGIAMKAPWIGGTLFFSGILSFFLSKKIVQKKAMKIFKEKYC